MNTAKRAILNLSNTFVLLIDESASWKNYIVVRSNIGSEEEVNSFIKEFGKITNASYIKNYYIQNPKKVIFSKTWICQHSSHRKGENSRRNANCKARIHVLIKKINYFTIRNDKFLKGEFPLPCRIKINPIHSHSTNAMESLRMLRVPKEVNEIFFQYFEDGLTASQAKHFHETKILEEGGEIEDLANSINNPTDRHVSYLYNTWRQRNGSHFLAHLTKAESSIGEGRLPLKRRYFRHNRYWNLRKISNSSSWKDSFRNEDSDEGTSFYIEDERSIEIDSVAPDSTTNEIDCGNTPDNEITVEMVPVPEKVTCSPIVVKIPFNIAQVSATQEVQLKEGKHEDDSQRCHSGIITKAEKTKLFLQRKHEEDNSQKCHSDTVNKTEETKLFLKIKHEEDEYDIYGQHVASEMRALPDDNQRKILKAKLKTLIFKAHHGLLTMNDVTSNSDL